MALVILAQLSKFPRFAKWCFCNVEKIAFGMVSFAALWCVWSAITHEVYDRSPEDVIRHARKLEVATNTSNPRIPSVENFLLPGQGRTVVPGTSMLGGGGSLDPDPTKRAAPVYLPLQELRAVHGRGSIFVKTEPQPVAPNPIAPRPVARRRRGLAPKPDDVPGPDGAGAPGAVDPLPQERREGRMFAVVTGLIPLADQEALFEDALHPPGAVYSEDDWVEYLGFEFERRVETQPWEPVNLTEIGKDMLLWTGTTEEVVRQDALLQRGFAQRLPKGFAWNHGNAGHPKLPAQPKEDEAIEPEAEPAQPAAVGAPLREGPFGLGPAVAKPIAEPQPRQPKAPRDRLFRLIDFAVEAGKTYQYRVRLVVRNPNFGLPVKYLDDPQLADNLQEKTPWSKASDAVVIPPDVELYLGPVAIPLKDPKATFLVRSWLYEEGVYALHKAERSLSSLLNFQKAPALCRLPSGRVVERKIDIFTNWMVISIEGGELNKKFTMNGPRSAKDIKSRGQVLLLSPSGRTIAYANGMPRGQNYAVHAKQLKDLAETLRAQDEPEIVIPGNGPEQLDPLQP